MREIRQYGSEGGGASPLSLPYEGQVVRCLLINPRGACPRRVPTPERRNEDQDCGQGGANIPSQGADHTHGFLPDIATRCDTVRHGLGSIRLAITVSNFSITPGTGSSGLFSAQP
jgi:hypothetical protein